MHYTLALIIFLIIPGVHMIFAKSTRYGMIVTARKAINVGGTAAFALVCIGNTHTCVAL